MREIEEACKNARMLIATFLEERNMLQSDLIKAVCLHRKEQRRRHDDQSRETDQFIREWAKSNWKALIDHKKPSEDFIDLVISELNSIAKLPDADAKALRNAVYDIQDAQVRHYFGNAAAEVAIPERNSRRPSR